MTESIVQGKSYAFALRVIKLCRDLNGDKEYVLARQLLKSGTSIGANVEEALADQSRRDFRAKMSIASKEARETKYWLRLLLDSGLGDGTAVGEALREVDSLVRMLTAIVKTTQDPPVTGLSSNSKPRTKNSQPKASAE